MPCNDPRTAADDAARAHDAVRGAVRAGLDQLRGREARRLPFDQLSFSPSGPHSLKRCTQSRRVWRSMPPIRAAAARLIPSSTAAIDKSRRL